MHGHPRFFAWFYGDFVTEHRNVEAFFPSGGWSDEERERGRGESGFANGYCGDDGQKYACAIFSML